MDGNQTNEGERLTFPNKNRVAPNDVVEVVAAVVEFGVDVAVAAAVVADWHGEPKPRAGHPVAILILVVANQVVLDESEAAVLRYRTSSMRLPTRIRHWMAPCLE